MSRFFSKKKNLMSLIMICAAALFAAGGALGAPKEAPAGWPAHLRVVTGPNGGQWFNLGTPIAEALSEYVLPSASVIGGGVENIDNINKKKADVGFTLNCFLGVSGSGIAEYGDINLDNVSILTNIYPQVFYFLVRKDFADKNGVTSIESLLAKKLPVRFVSLKPKTASEFILSLLLEFGYGTNFKKLTAQGWDITFSNYAETSDNLVAGEIDCFAYTAGVDVPLIHTIEAHTEVVILPVSKKVLDKLSERFKTGRHTIGKGTYKCADKPILTLADYTCLIVRKDLPDDLVAEIARTLWQNREMIAGVVSDYGALSPETAIPKGLPAHPGAVSFWKSLTKNK